MAHDRRGRGRRHPHPGQDPHRAVVGQHGHRHGHDRQAQGLPDQDRPARERVHRAAPAARGVGAEIILSPGNEGSNGAVRRAQRLADEHPEWAFLYQYSNEANPRAHYETTGPEICATCPTSRTSWPGWAPAARSWGSALSSRSRTPTSRCWRSSPRSARRSKGCATSTRATSRRCTRSGVGVSCSTASASCGPANRSSGSAGSARSHLLGHLRRRGAGRCGAGGRPDRVGHHRVHRVRRRVEVPVHRGVDRSHRRGRRAGRADHLLLGAPPVPRWSWPRPRRRLAFGAWTRDRSACSTAGSVGSRWPGP